MSPAKRGGLLYYTQYYNSLCFFSRETSTCSLILWVALTTHCLSRNLLTLPRTVQSRVFLTILSRSPRNSFRLYWEYECRAHILIFLWSAGIPGKRKIQPAVTCPPPIWFFISPLPISDSLVHISEDFHHEMATLLSPATEHPQEGQWWEL